MEQLQATINEVQMRLTQVDQELETVGKDLDPMDSKSATQAVLRKGKLTQERERLLLRLPALEQALREAERTAASERLAVISSEMDVLAKDGARAMDIFSKLIAEASRLIEEAGRCRQQFAVLRDEAWYLGLLHDLDTTSLRILFEFNHEAVETLARLVRDTLASSTGNPWTFKLDQLRRDRQEEAARRQPQPQLRIEGGYESPEAVLIRQREERERERQKNILPRSTSPEQEDQRVTIEGNVSVVRGYRDYKPTLISTLLEDE